MPSVMSGGLLLFIAVGVPLGLSMVAFEPDIAIVTAAVVFTIVGGVLFTNVTNFAIFALPVIYIVVNDPINAVMVGLLSVSFLTNHLTANIKPIRIPVPGFIFLLILSVSIGYVKSLKPDIARYLVFYNLVLPVIAFLIYYNISPAVNHIRRFLEIVSVVAAIFGIISVTIYLQTGEERQFFGWPSWNRAAAFLGLVFPHTLVSFLDATDVKKRIYWLIICVGVSIGILTTQTRAIIFCSFIAAMYIGLKDWRAMRLVLIGVVLALVAVPALLLTRTKMMLGMGAVPDWSSIGRIQIWLVSLEFLRKYFLFGMGIDNFQIFYSMGRPISIVPAEHSHNSFIRIILDYGIFGFIGYFGVVVHCLKRAHRAVWRFAGDRGNTDSRLLLGLNASIVSALFANLLDSYLGIPTVAVFFWTIMAFQLVLGERLTEAET